MKQLKVWLVSGTHSPGLCRLKTSEQHPSYRLQVDGRCALKIIIFFPFRAGLKPIPLDRITSCACESAAAKAIKSSLYKLWFLMTLAGRAWAGTHSLAEPGQISWILSKYWALAWACLVDSYCLWTIRLLQRRQTSSIDHRGIFRSASLTRGCFMRRRPSLLSP